ncbi:hypothetical protein [Xenorhabdus anantnagensis]|uniref:Uncharacterized protein n=1 Tax=Xenorhabdus anantnagensis TaxID=3025875 RepID=A0ABT5LNN9_9GAMM|nr:hypothetical protein [Xenorhabdus anantnagensis]MDC9596047.1 hypothetical protein [Xenorhabdus anantnagensis]
MIQHILHHAIEYSHSAFPGKTTNISYFNIENQSEDRKKRYSIKNTGIRQQKLGKLQEKLYYLRTDEEKYDHIMSERKNDALLVGNCKELSLIAFMYLAKEKASNIYHLYKNSFTANKSGEIHDIYIEVLAAAPLSRYDHCFVMLYYPPHTYDKKFQNKKIDEEYNILPSGAWICDPWANIVCLSENYDTHWKSKMASWAKDGKYLALGSASISSNYKNTELSPLESRGHPLYANTFNMIENSKKKVLHKAIIKPDGSTEILKFQCAIR